MPRDDLHLDRYWTYFGDKPYNSGSQPVARGPKVARQALKSGPRPHKEF